MDNSTVNLASLPWAKGIKHVEDPNQSYLHQLQQVIVSFDEESQKLMNQKDTIQALSMFMYRHNEAYHYNLPYLLRRHDEFLEFVERAYKKYDNFEQWLLTFVPYASRKLTSVNCSVLSLSIDQLWELLPDSTIRLVAEFDLYKTMRKQSVITMSYEDNQSKRHFTKSVELLNFQGDNIITACTVLCNMMKQ